MCRKNPSCVSLEVDLERYLEAHEGYGWASVQSRSV